MKRVVQITIAVQTAKVQNSTSRSQCKQQFFNQKAQTRLMNRTHGVNNIQFKTKALSRISNSQVGNST